MLAQPRQYPRRDARRRTRTRANPRVGSSDVDAGPLPRSGVGPRRRDACSSSMCSELRRVRGSRSPASLGALPPARRFHANEAMRHHFRDATLAVRPIASIRSLLDSDVGLAVGGRHGELTLAQPPVVEEVHRVMIRGRFAIIETAGTTSARTAMSRTATSSRSSRARLLACLRLLGGCETSAGCPGCSWVWRRSLSGRCGSSPSRRPSSCPSSQPRSSRPCSRP